MPGRTVTEKYLWIGHRYRAALMIFWNRNTINKHRRASTSDNPWNSAKNAAPARAMLVLGQLT